MLSVAMIVKNEADTLRETINSVAGIADEIVIGVDSKSNDGTRSIANELATKVVAIRLSDELELGRSLEGLDDWGFSRARNVVLDKCDPGNWRLILDGHEIVKHPEKIVDWIVKVSAAKGDGIEVPIDFEPDADGVPVSRYFQIRLIAPSVIYRNAIHNYPVVKVPHQITDVSVEHRKKSQNLNSKTERDVQRSKANIESLSSNVEKNPTDARSWFYLGMAFRENARWEESINAFSEYLKIATWNEERWQARYEIARCQRALGNIDAARDQYSQCLEEFPAMAEAWFCLGDLAYHQQRFREAQVWLERCVELPFPKCKLFITPLVYLFNRHDSLSMVYDHLGMFEKAVEQGELALKGKKDPRVENNVSIWKKLVENKKNAKL